jgi:hypothetical protein
MAGRGPAIAVIQYPDGKEVPKYSSHRWVSLSRLAFFFIFFFSTLLTLTRQRETHGLEMWCELRFRRASGKHRILFSPAEPEH